MHVATSAPVPFPLMLREGLTGGIASGKTTVSDALGARGAVVIDADVLARVVVEPGTPGLAAIVERFGADVLADDGRLDRAALGRLVFADPAEMRADVAGKPVYLGLAMTAEGTLRLKPQNLLLNLPLAASM